MIYLMFILIIQVAASQSRCYNAYRPASSVSAIPILTTVTTTLSSFVSVPTLKPKMLIDDTIQIDISTPTQALIQTLMPILAVKPKAIPIQTPAPMPIPNPMPMSMLIPIKQKNIEAPTERKDDAQSLNCLSIHNKFRYEVGVGPLEWSTTLASKATDWAKLLSTTRSFKHSGSGENLMKGQTACDSAVVAWSAEQSRFKSKVIDGGYPEYGHYTQVVWRGSKRVGCGIYADIIVCRYEPPGNVVGQSPF